MTGTAPLTDGLADLETYYETAPRARHSAFEWVDQATPPLLEAARVAGDGGGS